MQHIKKVKAGETEKYKLIETIYNSRSWQYWYLPKLVESSPEHITTEFCNGIKYEWSEHHDKAGYGGKDIPTYTVKAVVGLIKELDYITNSDLQYRNIIFMDNGKIAVIDWESLAFSTKSVVFNCAYFWLLMFNNKEWQREFINEIRSFVSFDDFKRQALACADNFIKFWQDRLPQITSEMLGQKDWLNSPSFKLYWYDIDVNKIYYQYFNGLNEYDETKNSDSYAKLRTINFNFPYGSSVLDIGCSQGYFSIHASLNGCDVLGIDIDQQNIDIARKLSQFYGSKAKFEVSTIDGVTKQFDIVLCLSMLHYIEDKDEFFREVYIRCKKHFIIETPLRDFDYTTEETPKRYHISSKTLLSLLSKYFIIAGISKSNLADRTIYYLVRKT